MSNFKFSFEFPTDEGIDGDTINIGATNTKINNDNDDIGRIDQLKELKAETEAEAEAANEETNRMPLSFIDMKHLLLLQQQQQNESKENIWKSCNIEVMNSDYNLQRIAHTEQPFYQNDNTHDDDDNDTNNDTMIGISIMAQENNTDIIPGKYEGGLKVWECSIDLCNYLAEQLQQQQHHDFSVDQIAIQNALKRGGKTIELGCGHGLPACMILKAIMNKSHVNDDSHYDNFDDDDEKPISSLSSSPSPSSTPIPSLPFVLFTDYNSFVLRDVTLPNIILNCTTSTAGSISTTVANKTTTSTNDEQILLLQSSATLIAGDWMELSNAIKSTSLYTNKSSNSSSCTISSQSPHQSFLQKAKSQNGMFDLILASETTYTYISTKETIQWIYNHLKPNTGIALISMKRYYFGVGGSTDVFVEEANKLGGLVVTLIQEYNDGKSNIRDLLRVQKIET